MVPGAMTGYVPPAPPPAAPASPPAPAAAPGAPGAPGAPPAAVSDEDLEIPRRGTPVVPILIFVFLVAVLVGVGGFWLLRQAGGEARLGAARARVADAGLSPATQPVAAVDTKAPASQAPSQPASQPTSTPATQPAAEK